MHTEEKRAKYEELLQRDKEMTAFIAAYPDNLESGLRALPSFEE